MAYGRFLQVLAVLLLAVSLSQGVPRRRSCRHDGSRFPLKFSLRMGTCRNCTCSEGGVWVCQDSDPSAYCEDRPHIPECRYNNTFIPVHAEVKMDCNTCTCQLNGRLRCTEKACSCPHEGQEIAINATVMADQLSPCHRFRCMPTGRMICEEQKPRQTCLYAGSTVEVGRTAPSTDGCNSCTCNAVPGQPHGIMSCTERVCVKTECEYQGRTYTVGDVFPAGDGCNECECSVDVRVVCQEKACAAIGHAPPPHPPPQQPPHLPRQPPNNNSNNNNSTDSDNRNTTTTSSINNKTCLFRGQVYKLGDTWPSPWAQDEHCDRCQCVMYNENTTSWFCTAVCVEIKSGEPTLWSQIRRAIMSLFARNLSN